MVLDRKEYQKQYYIKNKEKRLKQNKQWVEDNKEKNIENYKRWCKKPDGIKSLTISSWKYIGLKLFGYTYDEVYEYYLDCDNCEICNKDISMGGCQKNMDHCHSTGCFRWVLCSSCNVHDRWIVYNIKFK